MKGESKKSKRIYCNNCNNKNIIKRGKQKTGNKVKQVYYCRNCKKRFVDSELKWKGFDAGVILSAISYYNLGNTLEKSSRLVNKRFKVRTSKSSISNWLKEFRGIYSYHRLRDEILEKYTGDIIASKIFKHKGLTYNYKYHKAKLELFGGKYKGLYSYLTNFEKNFPHKFFEEDRRCSQIKLKSDVSLKENKNNYACKIASLALMSASSNYERHNAVEEFMLINDTATIAVEVPVWFWKKDNAQGEGICGHIDILQIRFGNIWILDFKPDASKEKPQKVASQLYLYALGLSFRTGISLKKIRCSWFDEKNCYEFNPSELKIKNNNNLSEPK